MSDQPSKRRFFSSTTLERAVLEAAGHYGLNPEELAYSKVEKRGVASRGKVSIKVDPESPRVQAAPETETAGAEESAAVETPAAEAPDASGDGAAEVSPDDAAAESGEADGADEGANDPDSSGAETADAASAEDSDSGDADGTAAETEEDTADAATEAADEAAAGESGDEQATDAADDEGETDTEDDSDDEGDAEDAQNDDASGEDDSATAADSDVESAEMADLPRTSAEARRSWTQATGPLEQAARKWTESLLRVASLDLEVEIYERDGELEVHLGGPDAEVAVEDGGEVLRAIQHLLPRLMLGTAGEAVHCRVDCNDFRELHEERLRSQALSAAAEAVADRGEVTLDPMHPADRRIVHLALADNELVRTESLGRGFFKRVSIRGN